ncbi:MAG: hypothetical protein FJ387_26855, partial [Verrucomicrobia bacterium]|nr:hypothetical protein [Verrucomicrobiota bacterium]
MRPTTRRAAKRKLRRVSRRLFRSVLAAATLMLPASSVPTAHATDPPELRLDAPPTVAPGDTFVATVSLAGAAHTSGVQAAVRFEPQRLELLEVVPGEFLGDPQDDHATLWSLPEVAAANTTGLLRPLLGVRLGPEGVSGTGIICTLRFRERGGGASYATWLRLVPAATRVADGTASLLPLALRPALIRVTGDTDQDGLPDPWELRHLGTLGFSGASDPDGDGESNAAESANDTDPMNALSVNDPAHAYDRYRFRLFRNALDTPDGALA